MWILHSGFLGQPVPKSAMDQMLFIGPKDDPIGFVKRRELESYIDDDFMLIYEIWQKFNIGMGLPFKEPWAHHPKWMIDGIEILEVEYHKMRSNK